LIDSAIQKQQERKQKIADGKEQCYTKIRAESLRQVIISGFHPLEKCGF